MPFTPPVAAVLRGRWNSLTTLGGKPIHRIFVTEDAHKVAYHYDTGPVVARLPTLSSGGWLSPL